MNFFKKLFTLLFVLAIPSLSFSENNINKKYDVVSIGKAMVDIIEYVSEEDLIRIMPIGFKRSDTTRVDEATANKILAKMRNIIVIPGGSEANVMVDIASLGGKTAFNAIAANDEMGVLFKESLIKEKVDYLSPLAMNSTKGTARCFAFITPDKDRTFAVSAEIAKEINDNFIDYNSIKNSKVFYTDASNLSHGGAYEVTLKAIDVARRGSTIVAFNLNNNYYVEKYKDEITNLLPKIDIIIGSEKEAKNLFKVENLDEVISRYLEHAQIVVITQGERGATIASKTARVHIPSEVEVKKIVDLNGPGDAFAAGFLYGYTHGYTLGESGKIAAKTAAQIIYQVGPRPKNKLSKLVL